MTETKKATVKHDDKMGPKHAFGTCVPQGECVCGSTPVESVDDDG